MKTIISIFSLVLAISFGNAQTTSNSKVSIVHSSDKPGDTNYKINISISNTEDIYTLNGTFPKSKTEKLKQFLNDHLTPKVIKNGTMYTWKYEIEGDTGYAIKLKKGKLNVSMNKQLISADMVEDLLDIFTNLKEVLKE